MVVEGLLSNVLASVLMNGICCVHSMQEEETRRKEHEDFLRKTITVEMERHRLVEREIMDKQLREQGLADAAIVAEARRKLLIATKIQAKRNCSVHTGHENSSYYSDCPYSMSSQDKRRGSTLSPRSIVPPSSMNSRISSCPVWAVRDEDVLGSASIVSSLFDDDEDDDEDTEEVALQ
jgi:hypothetical protein